MIEFMTRLGNDGREDSKREPPTDSNNNRATSIVREYLGPNQLVLDNYIVPSFHPQNK